MKYGWANPNDGTREQDESLENATLRLWTELQNSEEPYWPLYEQLVVGAVSEGQSAPIAMTEDQILAWQPREYAYCDPNSGKRVISLTWPGTAIQEAIRQQAPRYTTDVTVYWQRVGRIVHKSDARPAAPPPAEPKKLSDLQLLRDELGFVSASVHMEPGIVIAKSQAYALLDIAESLRKWMAYTNQATEAAGPVETIPDGPVCSCKENGIAADGTFCVCAKGRELTRAAIVAGRQLPEPIPGCTVCYMYQGCEPNENVFCVECPNCHRWHDGKLRGKT